MNDIPQDQLYRIAAALLTEGTGGQSASDIFQVVKNRVEHGGYGSGFDGVLTGKDQFAGVTHERSGSAFKKIRTLQDASQWSGKPAKEVESVVQAIQNPEFRALSQRDLSQVLEFRASRTRYDTLPDTFWRPEGNPQYNPDNHNQFLTGPEDPKFIRKTPVPKPIPIVKPKPTVKPESNSNQLSIGNPYTDQNIGRWIF